jgi:hypothetical protein
MAKLYKFHLRLLHPKAITGKAGDYFFSFLASSLISETMPISGGSARRLWCLFFGAYYRHTLLKYFCSAGDVRVVAFFVSYLFFSLKSR